MNNIDDEIKALLRRLVARYAREGLGGLTAGEVRLLLSEKQLHLAQVSERCSQGQELHLNVPLKRALEGQVSEIANYQQRQKEAAGQARDGRDGRER